MGIRHYKAVRPPVSGLLPVFCWLVWTVPAAAEIRALPVPAATIYPDEVINGAMLSERRFRVTTASVRGFATSGSAVLGKQARRRLIAGEPIPLAALADRVAVRRGMSIAAAYQEDGFTISTFLIALQDGSSGDVINARNAASGAIVRALVRSDGTLLVTGE